MALAKYHFKIENRPRTQHRIANGLNKRSNDYRWREKQIKKLPVAPWFDVHERVMPNGRQFPAHLQNTQPDPKNVVCRVSQRRKRRQVGERRERALRTPLPEARVPTMQTHEDFYPDYPEDWIAITEEARENYLLPMLVANIASRMTDARDQTVDQAMTSAPTMVRQAALAQKFA